jgi:hypothetical protein
MLSTKMIVPVALAAAFTFALSDQAQAKNGHRGHGGGHHGGGHHGGGNHGGGHHGGGNLGGLIGSHIGGHRGGHGGHGGHVYQPTRQWNGYRRSYRPTWNQPRFHDTTHLDYHAPQVTRHGNHLHVQPGHYDVHRSGHWH